VDSGNADLDGLLLGGIPENYSVVLTSPSCDERQLLINKFLRAGIQREQITFHITTDIRGNETLATESANYFLIVCNAKAGTMFENVSNVFKLDFVNNLTEIDIALFKAFRNIDTSKNNPKRACIEILSDVLLQHGAVVTRKWLGMLLADLKARGFTTLAVFNPKMHPEEDVEAILGLFNGEIQIYERESDKTPRQFLRIRRLLGQQYLENELVLQKR
jgi:hypothetical protein